MTYTAARGKFCVIIISSSRNSCDLILWTCSKARNRQRRRPPIPEIHRAKHPSAPSAARPALRPKVDPSLRRNPRGSLIRPLGHFHLPYPRHRCSKERPSLLRHPSQPLQLLHRQLLQLPPWPRPHIPPPRHPPQMAPKIPHEPLRQLHRRRPLRHRKLLPHRLLLDPPLPRRRP